MPTTPLTLYTHPFSRGRIARWMLEETGRSYDTVVLDYGGSMKADEYRAINPMGKVPAIRHGNVVVTEAAAICAYLADQFPLQHLAPAVTSAARGIYYRWLFFAAGPLEAAVTAHALNLHPGTPEQSRTAGYGSYADVLDTLEIELERTLDKGSYLCGEHFTAADLYLASHLMWGLQFGTIEKRPVFERYIAPILGREAHVRASAIDDELAATMQGNPAQT